MRKNLVESNSGFNLIRFFVGWIRPQRGEGAGTVPSSNRDEELDDLRAKLRRTRWPDQVPGIGWQQGTELAWLRRIVSYWDHEFDWRAWERRLIC